MKINLIRKLKWLYPGMGIKRWIIFSAFGLFLVAVGSMKFQADIYFIVKILDFIVIISGFIILALGIIKIIRFFINVFLSPREKEIFDIIYQRKLLERGPKVVAIGGGSGLAVLLEGLKEYTSNVTAIVTVADDGGSSGRLREQFDILPPGDIRNCLVALADAPQLMRELFQFRFSKGSDLEGHSFGNLFITVMTQLTGDFEKAIKESSKVLAIRGQVIPSTLSKVSLVAQHKDGSITEGEAQIPMKNKPIQRVYLRPADVTSIPDATKAIKEANIIVMGPGSLYTSIIPNLLIKEITEAIVNVDAIKVYVCNIMTQPGETDGYSASDHVRVLIEHAHRRIINYCVVNVGKIPQVLLDRYHKDNSYPVVADSRKIRSMGYRVIEEDIVDPKDYIRHDTDKLARLLLGLTEEI
ncbi:MAG: YvcK family protein [Candidatus Omnitrophica bacterium]|nr:YvcK family protein [Candidatus Omnitrophota bacterium]